MVGIMGVCRVAWVPVYLALPKVGERPEALTVHQIPAQF